MKLRFFRGAFLLFLAALSPMALPQRGSVDGSQPDGQEVNLPNGKSQKDAILKAEREENIKDANRLVEMSEGLKSDLEKTDRFVLSLDTLKKTDDIEKLVKKIRTRLRH